jgi:hypothetical protein
VKKTKTTCFQRLEWSQDVKDFLLKEKKSLEISVSMACTIKKIGYFD